MRTLICLASISVVGLAVTGCNNNNTRNVSYSHLVNHPTPEMKGLSERPSDDRTAYKLASNQNWRMFWDDLGRTFVLDSPSRLHPFPTINTSGQGR